MNYKLIDVLQQNKETSVTKVWFGDSYENIWANVLVIVWLHIWKYLFCFQQSLNAYVPYTIVAKSFKSTYQPNEIMKNQTVVQASLEHCSFIKTL